MNKHFTLILVALLTLSATLQAQNIEKRILRLNEHDATVVAQFTETHVHAKKKQTTKKEGDLYFKNPDALALRYTTPQGDYSIIREDKFLVKQGAKKQGFVMNPKNPSKMFVLRNTLLYALAGNVEAAAKANNAKVKCEESATRFVCKLTVKGNPTQGVTALQLVYEKVEGHLLILRIDEANGNRTTYELSNAVERQTIPEEVWSIE